MKLKMFFSGKIRKKGGKTAIKSKNRSSAVKL
jgi:ubiquitin